MSNSLLKLDDVVFRFIKEGKRNILDHTNLEINEGGLYLIILAAFHLMPNMVNEYKAVLTAYEVRGMKQSFISLKVIFTMLVNSIRWSECVAMAMESKGFSGKNDRTYLEVTKVRWYDVLLSLITLTTISTAMFILR